MSNFDDLEECIINHVCFSEKANIELLKEYPEFSYEGVGYRVIYLDETNKFRSKDWIGRSFSKDLLGIHSYLATYADLKKNIIIGRTVMVFKAKIKGLDLNKATKELQKKGLLKRNLYMSEKEVVAFQVKDVKRIFCKTY